MKQVLVIASGFPPQGGGGVTRVHSFVKYMPELGWKPVVLTLKEKYAYPHAIDASLLNEYDPSVEIFRTRSLEPGYSKGNSLKHKVTGFGSKRSASTTILRITQIVYNWFLIPDERVLWIPFSLLKGLKLISSKKIDIIFVTSPPHSVSILGFLLKKYSGIPFILDIRDDWVGNRYFASQLWHRQKLERYFESRVISAADAIIVVTQESKDFVERKYPSARERIYLIPNGFDPEDFRSCTETEANRQKCRIVYSGSLTRRRNLHAFFEVLAELEQQQHISDQLEILFVGTIHEDNMVVIQDLNLENIVKFVDHVSHKESIQYLFDSDVCLLVSTSEEGSKTVIPSKIYEYIGAHKTILALADPDSSAARLIREGNIGIVIASEDKENIKSSLLEILKRYQTGNLKLELTPDYLNLFNRSCLTEKLTHIFNMLVQPIKKNTL